MTSNCGGESDMVRKEEILGVGCLNRIRSRRGWVVTGLSLVTSTGV